jgi:hypothetical protein
MENEITIHPQPTPAEMELNDALNAWSEIHAKRQRGEATREEEDAAWERRQAAQKAVDEQNAAKKLAGS